MLRQVLRVRPILISRIPIYIRLSVSYVRLSGLPVNILGSNLPGNTRTVYPGSSPLGAPLTVSPGSSPVGAGRP